MEELRKIANNVINLTESKVLDIVYLYAKTQNFATDLNTEDQLLKRGVGVDGSELTPGYTFLTEYIKSQLSGPGGIIDHVTLYDTGSFHLGWTFRREGESIILEAPPKFEDGEDVREELRIKYGEFEGLTDENITKLAEFILPLFIEETLKLI